MTPDGTPLQFVRSHSTSHHTTSQLHTECVRMKVTLAAHEVPGLLSQVVNATSGRVQPCTSDDDNHSSS